VPILAKETEVFPPDLLDGDVQVNGQRWWVAHTKPRQEKSLARQLLAKKVGFFLPQMDRSRRVRGKTVHSYSPVFASYLFVYGSEEERVDSLSTNRVVQMLRTEDQDGLHRDLQQVRRLTESGLPLYPESKLEPGTPVRIVKGSLTGLTGEVITRQGRHRFQVSVDFIQKGVSVELEADALELVDS
jgi:transcriptional antiterminator RfaH